MPSQIDPILTIYTSDDLFQDLPTYLRTNAVLGVFGEWIEKWEMLLYCNALDKKNRRWGINRISQKTERVFTKHTGRE